MRARIRRLATSSSIRCDRIARSRSPSCVALSLSLSLPAAGPSTPRQRIAARDRAPAERTSGHAADGQQYAYALGAHQESRLTAQIDGCVHSDRGATCAVADPTRWGMHGITMASSRRRRCMVWTALEQHGVSQLHSRKRRRMVCTV